MVTLGCLLPAQLGLSVLGQALQAPLAASIHCLGPFAPLLPSTNPLSSCLLLLPLLLPFLPPHHTPAIPAPPSSGVDVYTAMAGAVGALYGPLHGGANEAVLRMLERIGSVERIPEFIAGVKSKREKLFGFGHRVYKNFDPRAKIIRGVGWGRLCVCVIGAVAWG